MIFREQHSCLWSFRGAYGCSGWCSKCPEKPSNESITTIFIAESVGDAVPHFSHPKPMS